MKHLSIFALVTNAAVIPEAMYVDYHNDYYGADDAPESRVGFNFIPHNADTAPIPNFAHLKNAQTAPLPDYLYEDEEHGRMQDVPTVSSNHINFPTTADAATTVETVATTVEMVATTVETITTTVGPTIPPLPVFNMDDIAAIIEGSNTATTTTTTTSTTVTTTTTTTTIATWSDWSDCSEMCGNGIQQRKKDAKSKETRLCHVEICAPLLYSLYSIIPRQDAFYVKHVLNEVKTATDPTHVISLKLLLHGTNPEMLPFMMKTTSTATDVVAQFIQANIFSSLFQQQNNNEVDEEHTIVPVTDRLSRYTNEMSDADAVVHEILYRNWDLLKHYEKSNSVEMPVTLKSAVKTSTPIQSDYNIEDVLKKALDWRELTEMGRKSPRPNSRAANLNTLQHSQNSEEIENLNLEQRFLLGI